MSTRSVSFQALEEEIKRRGQKTLAEFEKSTVLGVENPQLLSILEKVKKYWKDYFRPALVTLSCESVGGQQDECRVLNLFLSLTFAGIGVHDDIIDKTAFKHFRATVLDGSSEEEALLAGDLLIMKGWAAIKESTQIADNLAVLSRVIEAYNSCTIELCEAEIVERSFVRNLETNIGVYKKMLLKAGSDLEICASLGAVVGHGKESEIDALAKFGRKLGYMSRLLNDVEDVLNLDGNLKHRLWFESVPLPLLYAARSSNNNYRLIKSCLTKPLTDASKIETLIEVCFDAEAFSYVKNISQENRENAIKHLNRIKPSAARDMLELMAERVYAQIDKLCN